MSLLPSNRMEETSSNLEVPSTNTQIFSSAQNNRKDESDFGMNVLVQPHG